MIIKTSHELLRWRALINQSQSLGFTPTMGALHDGHLSLINKSMNQCDVSCVSIFLNPLQFSVGEDLKSYPQDIDSDIKKLENMGVDMIFIPPVDDVYNNTDTFLVTETNLSTHLEGESRPQFFSGVLTVVAKLFNLIQPSFAYFGMKDAQQLILIQKMVENMKYPINIVPCETVREHNGLAMSSRNEYLNKDQRYDAKIIYLSLLHAKNLISSGTLNPSIIKKEMEDMILSVPNFNVDYISIADTNTLREINNNIVGGCKILISLAVFLTSVRLIDNVFIET